MKHRDFVSKINTEMRLWKEAEERLSHFQKLYNRMKQELDAGKTPSIPVIKRLAYESMDVPVDKHFVEQFMAVVKEAEQALEDKRRSFVTKVCELLPGDKPGDIVIIKGRAYRQIEINQPQKSFADIEDDDG